MTALEAALSAVLPLASADPANLEQLHLNLPPFWDPRHPRQSEARLMWIEERKESDRAYNVLQRQRSGLRNLLAQAAVDPDALGAAQAAVAVAEQRFLDVMDDDPEDYDYLPDTPTGSSLHDSPIQWLDDDWE